MPVWLKPFLDFVLRLSPTVAGTVFAWLQSHEGILTGVVFLVSLLSVFITPPGKAKAAE